MNHACRKHFVYEAGGEGHCEICEKEYFFTELGISAREIIDIGGYNTPEKNGSVPKGDVDMIQYLYDIEIKHLQKKIKQLSKFAANQSLQSIKYR